ncbi:MAG: MMPL family transporter, partial [Corynebacteriales bacterium]|nr:MMPL family transporter [Mycobacteriales bacterium]
MSTYMFRLGRWAFHHRRYVVAFWVVVAAAVITIAITSGGKTNDNFSIPGTPSDDATELLQERIPSLGGVQTQIVFATSGQNKVTDQAAQSAIEDAMQNVSTVPQVTSIVDPFQANAISPNDQAALGQAQFTVEASKVEESSLDALDAAVKPARDAGLQVEFAGEIYPGSRLEISEVPEIIGIAIAFIILLITFGALVAAGLPIVTAATGVLIGLMGITGIAALVDVASAATSLAIMLGLSCGIDYALFILSRHRNFVLAGMAVDEAAPMALGTTGSSVVFAALMVIIALCGLTVAGIPFLTVMGLCAAGAVLIALLIAITLLPALLGFAGAKVTKFLNPPFLRGHAEKTARIAATEPHRTRGATWARFVVKFRIPLILAGVVLMAVIAFPVTHMSLGLPTGNDQPEDNTGKKAYELIEDNFGVGFNGPLLVVVDLDKATNPQQATQTVISDMEQESGVAAVSPGPSQNNASTVQVIPKTGPDDSETADLVNRIRDDNDTIEKQTGATILVGGLTATNVDASDRLASALPPFFAVVVSLAFVLLTVAFRTILVPITSIVGFVLSVLAALGAQVAAFQWGWLADLLNITPDKTVSFLPLIVLAVIFGLSSDYE